MEIIKEVVYHIRNIRGEMNVPPSQKADVVLYSGSSSTISLLKHQQRYFVPLAWIKKLSFCTVKERPKAAATAVIKDVEIFVPLAGLIDFGEEEKRIKKEIAKVDKELTFVRKKLSNEDFLAKAPQEIVEKEKQRRQDLIDKEQKLSTGLARLIAIRDAR